MSDLCVVWRDISNSNDRLHRSIPIYKIEIVMVQEAVHNDGSLR